MVMGQAVPNSPLTQMIGVWDKKSENSNKIEVMYRKK